MEDKSIIDQINQGLSRYYLLCSRNDYFNDDNQQQGKFKFYCNDYGLEDDEAVLDDFEAGATECIICEFDDDFPFIDRKNRQKAENDQEAKQKRYSMY